MIEGSPFLVLTVQLLVQGLAGEANRFLVKKKNRILVHVCMYMLLYIGVMLQKDLLYLFIFLDSKKTMYIIIIYAYIG